MQKKILITGASGFIGRFLVDEALHRGYEVWAGVRKSSRLDHWPEGVIRRIDLNYTDAQALHEQVQAHCTQYGRWDYVIHNAGLTKTTRPADFFTVNTDYTRRLIDALTPLDCRPDRFVLMSSLSCFGGGDPVSLRPIRPDDPQHPETVYGRSKLAAETYVRSQTAIPYTILRPTGVYGPGDRDYLMAIQSIRSGFDFAAGRRPQHITFIYAADLARVALDAAESDVARGRSYFVADGDTYTDTDFSKLIQRVLGRKHVVRLRVPSALVYVVCVVSELIGRLTGRPMTLNTDKYRILKQRNWICDIEPLRTDLHFVPAYNLQRGLEATVADARRRGELS